MKRTYLPNSRGQQLGAATRLSTWYGSAGTTTTAALTAGNLLATPFFVSRTVTTSNLGVNVTTLAASSTIRMGVYADVVDAYGSYPGVLVGEGATQADSSSTGFKSVAFVFTLTPGLYWLAGVAQGGAPSVSGLNGPSQVVGVTGSNGLSSRCAYRHLSVTSTLPSPFTATPDAQGTAPQVQIMYSA